MPNRCRTGTLILPYFPGLRPGDRWCLCAARWLEAHAHGRAPKVLLSRTHQRALEVVPFELLRSYALDMN
ncbi:MAG: DUF2237 family protein [Gammaproteobacteria bacterium]|nr:DUF2237 family protein [Gammaproteobacteria bacterium]